MIVRPESDADHAAISAVVEAAFGDVRIAKFIEDIRGSDNYVPRLALVAEEEGDVVGHTMLSYAALEGRPERILMLSPMAVRPDRQRRGVGTALARTALARADELGEPLVLVEGIPAYYPRFGFRPAEELGLERPFEQIPPEAWLAIPLRAYDPAIRGRVVYPPPFAPFY